MTNIAEREPAILTEGERGWRRQHLLDTDTLAPDEVELIMETADAMAEVRGRQVSKVATLRGVTAVTLFYENSTRTRASFEVAGKVLGADVINIAASSSSVAKGESLVDTVRTLEAVGADVLVLRHPRAGAPYLAAQHTTGSVVNAGDGAHAHPTQALLDLYTMRRHLGSVEGRRVAIVGDILHSRVARSNLWLLLAAGAEVVLCGPPSLLPRTLGSVASERGSLTVTTSVEEALRGADVVMALRVQRERQAGDALGPVREYARNYQITEARLGLAREDALVMHPGPMNEGVEIAPAVARSARSVIEEQVASGVAVRMALLYLLTVGRAR